MQNNTLFIKKLNNNFFITKIFKYRYYHVVSGLLDSYEQTKYLKQFGLISEQALVEHRTRFQPCLDQINQKNILVKTQFEAYQSKDGILGSEGVEHMNALVTSALDPSVHTEALFEYVNLANSSLQKVGLDRFFDPVFYGESINQLNTNAELGLIYKNFLACKTFEPGSPFFDTAVELCGKAVPATGIPSLIDLVSLSSICPTVMYLVVSNKVVCLIGLYSFTYYCGGLAANGQIVGFLKAWTSDVVSRYNFRVLTWRMHAFVQKNPGVSVITSASFLAGGCYYLGMHKEGFSLSILSEERGNKFVIPKDWKGLIQAGKYILFNGGADFTALARSAFLGLWGKSFEDFIKVFLEVYKQVKK